jgi:type II secretory pathway pseudopilin PulG
MRGRRRGFSYLVLLFWIAISGVVLAALGQSWSLDARRAREKELAFRGREYALALGSYSAAQGKYPEQLSDLLEDRGKGDLKRHLRRLYPDPITGSGEWGLERDDKGGIVAVYSLSTLPLVRRKDEVRTYRQWVFRAQLPAGVASAPVAASAVEPNTPFKPLFPPTPASSVVGAPVASSPFGGN